MGEKENPSSRVKREIYSDRNLHCMKRGKKTAEIILIDSTMRLSRIAIELK